MTYAINKTPDTIALKQGYLQIPPYAFVKLNDSDKEHPHVEEAVSRGWIDLSEVEPVLGHAPVEIQTETPPTHQELVEGGLSESEYAEIKKAEDEAKAAAAQERQAALEASITSVEAAEVKLEDLPQGEESPVTEVQEEASAAPEASEAPARRTRKKPDAE
jgi:hypothetical protein